MLSEFLILDWTWQLWLISLWNLTKANPHLQVNEQVELEVEFKMAYLLPAGTYSGCDISCWMELLP